MGTHWKKNFDYRYTGAYELLGGLEKTLTIKKTCTEDVMSTSGQKQKCFVAYFDGQSKPMVLNKTNCKTIESLYGPEVESWIGKSIIVRSEKVKAFGETVDALRVKKSKPVSNVDFSKETDTLRSCPTLSDLQSAYTALPPAAKAALITVKDEMKAKLNGGVN